MKIAFISDIHSNIEALESVLRRLDEIKPDRIICLGDVIGYGPNPNECMNIIRESVDLCLAGNHEYGVLGRTPLKYFNENARIGCEWTRGVLSDENFDYMKELPVSVSYNNMLLVHSTPINPEKWDYILTQDDASFQFRGFTESLCFVGHSHIPACFFKESDKEENFGETEEVHLKDGKRYIINFGSVGQPRDYDPRASFGVIDTEKRRVEIVKVAYDIEKVQKKIIESGLPPFLAERLAIGR